MRKLILSYCLLAGLCDAATGALLVASPAALIATRLATGAALAWVYPPAMKVAPMVSPKAARCTTPDRSR